MEHTSFVQGNNQIVLQGSCRGDPKGIQFSAMLDLQIGGAAVVSVLDGKKLKVEGADWVVWVGGLVWVTAMVEAEAEAREETTAV
ncbi:hypothetical protein LINPERPRIM_LOCUS11233 [Linum perenne]